MSVTKHYICLLSLRFVTIFNDLKIKIFLQIKSWHLAVRWPKNNLKILIKIIKPFTSTSDATVDVWFLCQTYPVPYIPYHLSQTRLLCGESDYFWDSVHITVCVFCVCGCVCVYGYIFNYFLVNGYWCKSENPITPNIHLFRLRNTVYTVHCTQ